MLRKTVSVCVLAWAGTLTVMAAEITWDKIRCVVGDRPAQEAISADYKDGQVHFCCVNCRADFVKDQSKHVGSANRQLVATGQYQQKGCPFSGGAVDPSVTTQVDGVEVAFCCGGCKRRVESTEENKRTDLVFAEKSFDQAFAKAK